MSLLLMISGFGEPKQAYGQEVLRGLDLSTVGLYLFVPGEFHKVLEERAKTQFHEAGLKLGEENNYPSLRLSLRPKESRRCKEVAIYQPKLELLEEVALVRSGHKRIVTTWFLGQEFGYETDRLSLADLQEKQDEMLKVFIDQYKFLNPKK
ncbi:MAG: hypothetical protein OEY86_17505 [Nitrospira sp.]|nr:hypothetical protein [Nitrospira sp.]